MDRSTAAGQIRTRLDVLFAAAAPKAVILRRGPRTHWRLIDWDLRKDTFTPGQWMKGLIRLWDLSPSGEKLIYWAAQHHASAYWRRTTYRRSRLSGSYDPMTAASLKPPRPGRRIPRYMRDAYAGSGKTRHLPADVDGTWTAVSTPPFFTALAIWPAFGHWTGGGLFRTERNILVMEPESRMTPIENVPIPASTLIDCWFGSGHGLNRSASGPSQGVDLPAGPFRRALTEAGAHWIEWIHIAGHDLLFACDGCVYRLPRWQDVLPGDYLRSAKQIADFRDMRFEPIAAPPKAMRW
jgi:hypothetical protein